MLSCEFISFQFILVKHIEKTNNDLKVNLFCISFFSVCVYGAPGNHGQSLK